MSHSVDGDLIGLLVEEVCSRVLLRNHEEALQVVSKHTHAVLGSHVDTPPPRAVLLSRERPGLDSELIQLLESNFEVSLHFTRRMIVHVLTDMPDVAQISPVVAHVHIGLNLHVSVLESCNSDIEAHGDNCGLCRKGDVNITT